MEAEDTNKKTKRGDDDENPGGDQTKRVKLTAEPAAADDEDIKELVCKAIRGATRDQLQNSMIAFLEACDTDLYVWPGEITSKTERIASLQATQSLVAKMHFCDRFYRRKTGKDANGNRVYVDDDASLWADYELFRPVCNLHIFYNIAYHWSRDCDTTKASHQLLVLFHALRHHAREANVPLAPLLMRLMEIALDLRQSPAINSNTTIARVPEFAKPLLAAMHYSNLELLVRCPQTGYWGFVVDDIKYQDSFVRLAYAHLRDGTSQLERARSLDWACEAAQSAIVDKYQAARKNLRLLDDIKTRDLRIRVKTGQYYDFDERADDNGEEIVEEL